MCALYSNDIKVNDHKSPSATPKIALLLPQKPLVPEKLLRQSQKRKYQQNLEFPQKQEAQQRSQIRQLPPILQPHAAGVKGPTDASNSPSFINPAKVIKPDNAQQERRLNFPEEQHRTLELRSERILEKLEPKTLTELITLQMNNPEEYVSHLIGGVIFKKRMDALDTLESQLWAHMGDWESTRNGDRKMWEHWTEERLERYIWGRSGIVATFTPRSSYRRQPHAKQRMHLVSEDQRYRHSPHNNSPSKISYRIWKLYSFPSMHLSRFPTARVFRQNSCLGILHLQGWSQSSTLSTYYVDTVNTRFDRICHNGSPSIWTPCSIHRPGYHIITFLSSHDVLTFTLSYLASIFWPSTCLPLSFLSTTSSSSHRETCLFFL